tara:strand:+ start:411 stop:773 length:363 start_codon:yes stop_codon:yes gene_type:complete
MAKIGVELKIDVTKINKQLLFSGAKGTYLDATVFIDIDEKDQYDNNGMITQKVPKDGVKNSGAILGNCKVFWNDGQSQAPQQRPQAQQQPQQYQQQAPPQNQPSGVHQQGMDSFDDDIPF